MRSRAAVQGPHLSHAHGAEVGQEGVQGWLGRAIWARMRGPVTMLGCASVLKGHCSDVAK